MAAKAKKSRTPKTLSLTGATVVLPKRPGPTACAAAAELARFLYELTGEVSQVSRSAGKGPAVWLGDPGAARAGVAAESDALGEQGYRLAAVEGGVAIAAASEVGLLYGVYGLLEELGMGFYAGGPTYPDRPLTSAATCCITTSWSGPPAGAPTITSSTSTSSRGCAATCC